MGTTTGPVTEPVTPPTVLCETVERLHTAIDDLVAPLTTRHAERLQCRRGCCNCCVDDLTVFYVEADVIRRHYPELLEHGLPHPVGACAFLNEEGGCRIYPHRPYVCRTQGLPLRWIDETGDGERVEYRDICPLNEDGPPVESLPPEACWSIGPIEYALSGLQDRSDSGAGRRVALRSLFRSNGEGED